MAWTRGRDGRTTIEMSAREKAVKCIVCVLMVECCNGF